MPLNISILKLINPNCIEDYFFNGQGIIQKSGHFFKSQGIFLKVRKFYFFETGGNPVYFVVIFMFDIFSTT